MESLKTGRIASIIGSTATLTDFDTRSVEKNTEEEALLGVSLTGICDHYLLGKDGKDKVAKEMKMSLLQLTKSGLQTWYQSVSAITCVKPSGTVSQLVDSASGIHPRFSKQYIRRVRADKKDPLAEYMSEAGFPVEQDVMNQSSVVFSFPIKAPKDSTVVKEVGAMQQLRLWKKYQDHWCEHNLVTVYYTDDEFLQIAQWIWENLIPSVVLVCCLSVTMFISKPL